MILDLILKHFIEDPWFSCSAVIFKQKQLFALSRQPTGRGRVCGSVGLKSHQPEPRSPQYKENSHGAQPDSICVFREKKVCGSYWWIILCKCLYSDEVIAMAGLYRRCQPYQALYSLVSSPFILGIVIGILLNVALRYLLFYRHSSAFIESLLWRNTEVSDVAQHQLHSPGDRVVLEDVEDVPSPDKDTAGGETQKKDEKNFVRPRFVKVWVSLSCLDCWGKISSPGGTEHHQKVVSRHLSRVPLEWEWAKSQEIYQLNITSIQQRYCIHREAGVW